MQPQQQPQQVVIQQPGVVQPMYIAQPVTRAPVVETYAHRQSTVLGAVLIVAGALSIIFNIIDLAVGIRATYIRTITSYWGVTYTSRESYTLSFYSAGVVGHGLWSGALVGI